LKCATSQQSLEISTAQVGKVHAGAGPKAKRAGQVAL